MGLRDSNIARLDGGTFDVLVVGGGINGAVSAASLASRGARVAVIDRGDFAGFTSMQSSNLVWGGFKYLENYELKLVRDLCMSRNHLIKAYPANLKEIRFLKTKMTLSLLRLRPRDPRKERRDAKSWIEGTLARARRFALPVRALLFCYRECSLEHGAARRSCGSSESRT